MTQVGIANNDGEEEPMELEDQDEEDKMPEELNEDTKSLEEGEECTLRYTAYSVIATSYYRYRKGQSS